jgi:hypothetical protein
VKFPSFEAIYPTKRARELADQAFDRLPLSTSLGEAIRVWDLAYLEAGGIVKLPQGIKP